MTTILIHSYQNFDLESKIKEDILQLTSSSVKLPVSAIWQFPNLNQKLNINLIRQLQSQLIKKTGQKILIYFFTNFHHTSPLIQNSLLKVIEEPPKNTFFILHTQNLSAILDTLRSRCQIISDPRNHFPNSLIAQLEFSSWTQFQASQLANFLHQKIQELHLNSPQKDSEFSFYIFETFNQLLLELDQSIIQKKITLKPIHLFLLKTLIKQAQNHLKNNLSPKNVLNNFSYQFYQQISQSSPT